MSTLAPRMALSSCAMACVPSLGLAPFGVWKFGLFTDRLGGLLLAPTQDRDLEVIVVRGSMGTKLTKSPKASCSSEICLLSRTACVQ